MAARGDTQSPADLTKADHERQVRLTAQRLLQDLLAAGDAVFDGAYLISGVDFANVVVERNLSFRVNEPVPSEFEAGMRARSGSVSPLPPDLEVVPFGDSWVQIRRIR